MRFILVIAAFFILVAVPTLSYRLARRRLSIQMNRVVAWQSLPSVEERERCLWEAMREQYRAEAMRWQLGAATAMAGVGFAAVSLWLIYDVAHNDRERGAQVAELAADNCQLSEQFLSDEQGDTSREIGVLTAEIVAIQDAIDNRPTEIQSVAGYEEAPDWFRVFLSGLLDDQIADANEEIIDLRTRRTTLENREVELERLLASSNCPRR